MLTVFSGRWLTSWQACAPSLAACSQVSLSFVLMLTEQQRSSPHSPDSSSGRSHRLAHLPLGTRHPEEDRAGQGVLTTAPPSGCTDRDAEHPEDWNGRRGGGRNSPLLHELDLKQTEREIQSGGAVWIFLSAVRRRTGRGGGATGGRRHQEQEAAPSLRSAFGRRARSSRDGHF